MVREALSVVGVLRAVIADEVVCQLVAEGDPPVSHGFDQAFRSVHVALVQLLEEAQIAEDAAIAVESDGTACLIGKDVEGRDWQVEDRRTVDEEHVERCESGLVFFVEDVRVRRMTGKEELHALADFASECEVVTRFVVAVCWGLFDFLGFWAGEERVCTISS